LPRILSGLMDPVLRRPGKYRGAAAPPRWWAGRVSLTCRGWSWNSCWGSWSGSRSRCGSLTGPVIRRRRGSRRGIRRWPGSSVSRSASGELAAGMMNQVEALADSRQPRPAVGHPRRGCL